MGLCRSTGCKVTSCQSWRMILLSGNQTRAARMWFKMGKVAEFFSNLQLWKLVTLQPVDLKRPAVPLWKDLNLPNIQNFNQRTNSIHDTGFACSKWPHSHRAYLLGVWHSFSVTALPPPVKYFVPTRMVQRIRVIKSVHPSCRFISSSSIFKGFARLWWPQKPTPPCSRMWNLIRENVVY